jgi:hypothetical protein
MEIAALSGLLGLGYLVSKASGRKNHPDSSSVSSVSSVSSTTSQRTAAPSDHGAALFQRPRIQEAFQPTGRGQEPFQPAARGRNADPLTVAPKGASATGFGPELDQLFDGAASRAPQAPYGNAFDYATQTHASTGHTGQPQPIDSSVAMMEYRSDHIEAAPQYIDADYVVSPLSGQRIPSSEFKHNNMQPFIKDKNRQNMRATANTGILDALNGGGSTQIKKREVENMFANAQAPYGNPFGMEDNTEFIQSRIASQPPVARNNERPFEPTRVGPGLGDKFGVAGQGGFQQLEINEIMRPKDTDELRVATKPKVTFETPVVPGQHFVGSAAQSGDIGEVRKYRPDRFYVDETGERYFVTTGDMIKETVRSTQVLPHTTRPETSTEYTGIAASQDYSEGYVTGSYRMPMTQQYGFTGYRNADATGYYTADTDAEKADYGRSSIEIRPNERNETSERVMALNLAPADTQQTTIHYEDEARPTRRGEIIGNIRMTGTPYSHVDRAPAITVWSNDVARTTVKESTIYLDRPGIAGGDGSSLPTRLKVYDPEDIAKRTQKEQVTMNSSWTGPGGNGAWSDAMDTQFAHNMRTNPLKEQVAVLRRPIAGAGSVATFKGDPGRQTSKKLDVDITNDRPLAVNRSVDLTPGVGDLGRVEYRVPLQLDVSRQRNTYSAVEAVDNNPFMATQNLRKNAELDEKAIQEYRQFLAGQGAR